MSGYAKIVPAEADMAGVPVHEQLAQKAAQEQTLEPQKPASDGKSRGKGKYKLKQPRRTQNDIWPTLTGNEWYDIERLWAWVNRGAATKAQRKAYWKGERMDVADAWRLLQAEKRRLWLLSHQQVQTPMPLQQVQPGMAQHAVFDPADVWGCQYPAPPNIQHLQSAIPAQQVPIGMPQHVNYLQGQGWGYQNPFPQQMQVSQPAPQFQFSTGHSADYLLAPAQQLAPAINTAPGFEQPNPGFSETLRPQFPDGLQGQPFGSNDMDLPNFDGMGALNEPLQDTEILLPPGMEFFDFDTYVSEDFPAEPVEDLLAGVNRSGEQFVGHLQAATDLQSQSVSEFTQVLENDQRAAHAAMSGWS